MQSSAENTIVCADSKDLLKYVKLGSVHLTITSPPYRNAIDYSAHIRNVEKSENGNYRGARKWSTEQYLRKMRNVFDQVYDVTIPGGFCCIIIGYEIQHREIIPLPSLLLTELLKKDRKHRMWKLREEIVWNKVTAGRNGAGNRFGVTVQHPYPAYYHANIMHEYIYVLSKGDTNPRVRRESEALVEIPINDVMKREICNSTWNIAPVPPRSVAHPCPFPEQIPWRLILLYSYPNDLILDPFNGSGQTTKVAKLLGRRYIGIDSQKDYVALAKERLQKEKLGFQSRSFLVPKYNKMQWEANGDQEYGFSP